MTTLYKEGFDFGFKPSACLDCPGYCCTGESGRIWVSPQELQKISSFLGLVPIDFINQYLVAADNRFSLREYPLDDGFACLFFDAECRGCRIYPVRPSQCLQYPFWPFFRDHPERVIKECPGVSACPK